MTLLTTAPTTTDLETPTARCKPARLRFRAMGTDAEVIVVCSGWGNPLRLALRAQRRIDELERRWSRFLPDSEISELNRRAGEWVRVSDDTVELVRLAVEAWRLSGGSVDPTVLGSVIRAGYDRSFESIGSGPAPVSSWLLPGCGDIEIDGNAVRLPAGTGFDPGGFGKGLAADKVATEMMATEMMAAGADGVCVNLGGDLRVIGQAPQGDGWTVAVEHPWLEAPLINIGLSGGAVATSTTLRRRWRIDGEERHHLIDPGTGLPSDTDLTLVTVVTGTAWMAEVLAKAVLLRGAAHPFDLIGGLGAVALAVDDTGRIVTSDGFDAFVGAAPLPETIDGPPERALLTDRTDLPMWWAREEIQ